MVGQFKRIVDFPQKTPLGGSEKIMMDDSNTTVYGTVADIVDLAIDDASSSGSKTYSSQKISADLGTHTGNATIHRSINDASTAATDLWSASKISTSLAGKSNTGHTHTSADTTDFAEAVDDRVNALLLVNADEITKTYNDAAGTLTLTHPYTTNKLLCRQLVSLTTAAQTSLMTVPTGKTAYINSVVVEGQTTISGGTTSVLKVGTTAGSYGELLNSTTGHSFTSGTATTLLAVGKRVNTNDLYPPTGMSTARAQSFAATTVLQADVSGGTPVTAGAVYVELWGYLA